MLCVSITNPVLLAETQLQEIELGSEGEQGSSDGDKGNTGYLPGLTTNDLYALCPIHSATQSPVPGSDAYLSCILHGPPLPVLPV